MFISDVNDSMIRVRRLKFVSVSLKFGTSFSVCDTFCLLTLIPFALIRKLHMALHL
jgi:hypothetical protein